jgi:hypothetical protein
MKIFILIILTYSSLTMATIKRHGSIEAIQKHIAKRLEKADKAYNKQMERLKSRSACFENYDSVFKKMEANLQISYDKLQATLNKIENSLIEELEQPLSELDAKLELARVSKSKGAKRAYKNHVKRVKELQEQISEKISAKFNEANEAFVTMGGLVDVPLRRTHKVDRKNVDCQLNRSTGSSEEEFECTITGSYRNQFGTHTKNVKTVYRRKPTAKELRKLQKRGRSESKIRRLAKGDAIKYHKDTAGNLFDICKSDTEPKGSDVCVYLVGEELGHWARNADVTNFAGNIPLTKGLKIKSKRYNSPNMQLRIKQITKATAESLPIGKVPDPLKCIMAMKEKKESKPSVFDRMRGWFKGKDKDEDDGLGELNGAGADEI